MRFPDIFCLVSALALPLLLMGCAKPSVWTVSKEWGGVCRTTERCVSSPNFPQKYGYNELCVLHVNESGILNIEYFDTETSDYLTVGDFKFSGDIGNGTLLVSPDTTIEWTSDFDGVSKGWRACLEPPTPAPPSVWTSTAEMGGVCRTTERCVSSPNFPQNYGNNEFCVLHVNESGILHIEYFSGTEIDGDYLTVGDFRFRGYKGNGTLPVSPDTTIEWTSDAIGVSKGWRACLEPPTPPPPSVWTVSKEWRGVCRTTERCVSSPNFPQKYGTHEFCVLHVNESGILHIESFDTESTDYLTVGDFKFSGNIGNGTFLVNPDTTIEWTSDYGPSGKGWLACLEPPTPAPPSLWTSTVEMGGPCRTTERCVSSPNFPQKYGSNELCVLHVKESGILNIEYFDTDSSDHLIVGDVKLTGDIGGAAVPVNPDTTIEWTSDASRKWWGTGWRACLEPRTQALPSVWASTAEMSVFVA